MDCPQCGAEVPSDDVFCGKCGYAMRDHGPERLDQSRIRVHEEPDPVTPEQPARPASQQRVRKHTRLGMPAATPPAGTPAPPSAPASVPPPPPPAALSSVRSERVRTRTPQKTMIGIPRHELPGPDPVTASAEPLDVEPIPPSAPDSNASSEPAAAGHRERARVRYDSANEPLPVTQRRQKALRGLAMLVLLAAAWLGYRFLTVNG